MTRNAESQRTEVKSNTWKVCKIDHKNVALKKLRYFDHYVQQKELKSVFAKYLHLQNLSNYHYVQQQNLKAFL